MPRSMLHLLSGVVAAYFALLGARLADARAGIVPPAPSHRHSPPSLLAHSRHRFYYDSDALEAQMNAEADAPIFSASLEDFLSPDLAILSAGFADGAFNSAYRLNLRTGAMHQDKWLTHQIRDVGYVKPRGWDVSPDRKWILWKDGWLVRNYAFVATPAQHAPHQQPHSIFWNLHSPVPVPEFEVAWFCDSRRWVQLRSPEPKPKGNPPFSLNKTGDSGSEDQSEYRKTPTEAYVYDLHEPRYVRHVSIAIVRPGNRLIGIAHDGRLITTTDDCDESSDTGPRRIDITTFRLDAPQRTRRFYSIHAPLSGYVQAMTLSPDGRSLAWLIADAKNTDKFTLAISAPQSPDRLRVIGQYTCSGAQETITWAGWLPDSRSLMLSFSSPNPKERREDMRQIDVR